MFSCENPRETIVKIQANEKGLRLNRVNIYIVATWENTSDFDNLRESFRENFSAVDITLIILLDESDNKKERKAAMYQFLSNLSAFIFDRIFLISNKNENGEIFPNSSNIYALVAALPYSSETSFNEILAAKTAARKEILFASAGFWQQPPSVANQNRALHKLAEIIENEMNKKEILPENFSCGFSDMRKEIISNMVSIAAKPLKFWQIWGRSVKEAETMLFGEEAKRFFNRVYLQQPLEYQDKEIKTLSQAVLKEAELSETILKTESKLRELRKIIEQSEKFICRTINVNYVKDKIGEIYACRFEYECLTAALECKKNEQAQLKAYIDYMRGVVLALKELPLSETCEIPYAPISISLLRNDDLIHETHNFHSLNGEACLLRIIGGFALHDYMV